jgi:hypothetical protein
MSKTQKAATDGPRRALHTNFTQRTLRHAKLAKKRQTRPNHKGFFMKLPNLLQSPMAAAITVGVIAMGAVGTYAAANWFNGHVGVQQNGSVLSVDLTACKNLFLPGTDMEHLDRAHVQFKVLGTPHINQHDLQLKLLQQCEFDAVVNFYAARPETKDASLHPSTITAIDSGSMTFAYFWGGTFTTKTFRVSDATVFNQNQAATQSDLHVGDFAVFATEPQGLVLEGTDPLATVTSVKSIFKTQYDTAQAPGASKKGFYDDANIMPLDWYNQVKNKLHI